MIPAENSHTPSPLYSGERAGVRGSALRTEERPPLILTLSPEYKGEGSESTDVRRKHHNQGLPRRRGRQAACPRRRERDGPRRGPLGLDGRDGRQLQLREEGARGAPGGAESNARRVPPRPPAPAPAHGRRPARIR